MKLPAAFFLLLTCLLNAQDTFQTKDEEYKQLQEELVPACCDDPIPILLEAKAGFFVPTSHLFRKIYGIGGGIYGLEFSIESRKNLYAWTSFNYFTKSGHSQGSHNKTSLSFIPIAFGFKYIFPFCNWDIYLAAGALATYLHINDHSSFVIRPLNKWGVGGIAKFGALWNITDWIFLDFFGDYSYMKIDFHNTRGGTLVRHDANISGFSFGGGFGFRF